MELEDAERELGIVLSDPHRQAMHDPTDPIHKACDFLVPNSPHELLLWTGVNAFLHSSERWNPWPRFLVAFASNGCGDYYAYDLRSNPSRIIYLDPYRTVSDNLAKQDALTFDSFVEWHERTCSQYRQVMSQHEDATQQAVQPDRREDAAPG